MQNFAFLLAELHEISACPVLKFLSVDLDWSSDIQCAAHCLRFNVTCKSDEDAVSFFRVMTMKFSGADTTPEPLPAKACATALPSSLRLSVFPTVPKCT